MWVVDCRRCTQAPPSAGGHRYRATSRAALLGLLLRHAKHGPIVVTRVDVAGRPTGRPTRSGAPRAMPMDVFERALATSARINRAALDELRRRGGQRLVRRVVREAERT